MKILCKIFGHKLPPPLLLKIAKVLFFKDVPCARCGKSIKLNE